MRCLCETRNNLENRSKKYERKMSLKIDIQIFEFKNRKNKGLEFKSTIRKPDFTFENLCF